MKQHFPRNAVRPGPESPTGPDHSNGSKLAQAPRCSSTTPTGERALVIHLQLDPLRRHDPDTAEQQMLKPIAMFAQRRDVEASGEPRNITSHACQSYIHVGSAATNDSFNRIVTAAAIRSANNEHGGFARARTRVPCPLTASEDLGTRRITGSSHRGVQYQIKNASIPHPSFEQQQSDYYSTESRTEYRIVSSVLLPVLFYIATMLD
ncbi:hypothetical protein A7U60_g2161 [Sanghuangporus baumii]|uniref:Uncharacterized protein n=1 Tax=Sanghuangporus baumii TaxID=108892 RepID=A0A9Q5I2T0_SANBA|nr:hypothetical protein A7U60_g2161 [Sanghuangporus baumii]